jgi:uncharacterized domain 1
MEDDALTMTNPEYLDLITRAHDDGTLPARMGIEFLEVSPERVVARMPVEGNRQPFGVLHGGASCVLAETIGSVGALLHAGEGRVAMGVEINATHHRPATSGHVTGVATRLFGGRNIATYQIEITDEQGGLVCTSRLTCLLRDSARDRADGLV